MRHVHHDAPGVSTVIALENGNLITGMVQDCDPIVEACKAAHNEGRHGSSDMKLAASVPLVVIERYMHDHGLTYEQFSHDPFHKRAILNDPALSHFRIWPGRV